jgi:hypothetical protein
MTMTTGLLTVRDTQTGDVAFLPAADIGADLGRYLIIGYGDEETEVAPLEAVTLLFAYGESLGMGTPACGVVQEKALGLCRAFGLHVPGTLGSKPARKPRQTRKAA